MKLYHGGAVPDPPSSPQSLLAMPEITQDNFRILLPGKIAKAVFLASEHSGEDCFEVAKRFYASPVYHELERESSKYWWLSPEQLESAMAF